jgi:hypothetical protein
MHEAIEGRISGRARTFTESHTDVQQTARIFHSLQRCASRRTALQVPCATVTTSFPRPRLSLTSPVYAAEA